MSFICRICGGEADEGNSITVPEMMYGTRDEFRYIECPHCHTLQIIDIPNNLGDYYNSDYYSFNILAKPERQTTESTDDRAILDVGCGAGKFLIKLYNEGAANLTGCDPFLSEDIHYASNFHLYKKSVHEMDGAYDQIYMNDSFEHVTDPHEVMDSLKRLLAPNGEIVVAMPVYPNFAFQEFGVCWYQIDAPRHIHIFSREAFCALAEKHNLLVKEVRYNSGRRQIISSHLYQLGIPYMEQTPEVIGQYFSKQDIEQITEICIDANAGQIGDHAKFYLTHLSYP